MSGYSLQFSNTVFLLYILTLYFLCNCQIKDITENAAYIRPVFVGELDARNGTLKKFTDFSPGLYPDSITALEGEEAARQSLRNQKPDNKEKKPKPAEKLKMEAVEEEEGGECHSLVILLISYVNLIVCFYFFILFVV